MDLRTSHIEAQISSLKKREDGIRAVAIRSDSRWDGPADIHVDDTPFSVVQCPSELALRQAMVESERDERAVVCITPLSDHDLGADVRARLARRRVIDIDIWDNVQGIFGARNVEGTLRRKKWLAEVLLDYYPDPEYAAVPTGTLTAQAVWGHVLRNLLGLVGEGPDLRDILTWTLDRKNALRYCDLDEARRKDVADRLRETAGEAGVVVLECVQGGQPEKAIPLCLACEVVFDPMVEKSGELKAAAARLEQYTGGKTIDPEIAQKLADSAVLLCESMVTKGEQRAVDRVVADLDETLEQCGAGAAAHISCYSSKGFEQLLDGFAGRVNDVLNGKAKAEDCWPYIARIRSHYQGRLAPERTERVDMAYRLLRWLQSGEAEESPDSAASGVRRYLASHSYVDWSLGILAGTEGNAALAEAYGKLSARVEEKRAGFDADFARVVAAWEGAESTDDVLGVEDVLDRVVAPLAEHNRVLLVVLDGMSCAVFDELMTDIHQRGHWYELTANPPARVACLATIPSITEVSRTSLLCGRLTKSGEQTEGNGFSSHPGLSAISAQAPVLYHKGDLTDGGAGQLSPDVRKAVLSPKRRVVGVVINAVDDYLLRGDQLRVSWTLPRITVLETLLQTAQETGRTVVLTSDHGHVMERGTKCMPEDSGGERHRAASVSPRDGEIQVNGPRVLDGNGELIVPWSSAIRYGAKRNGYHGGISPREMVVPIAVLSPTQKSPKGWGLAGTPIPSWWVLEKDAPVTRTATPPEEPEEKPLVGLPLFDNSEPAETHEWISQLLHSDVFQHNRRLCGRSPLTNDQIARLLSILEEHGGTVMQERLAAEMKTPAFRLPGLIRMAQRMLNVDGYAALTYEQNTSTISLDKSMLLKQFELQSS